MLVKKLEIITLICNTNSVLLRVLLFHFHGLTLSIVIANVLYIHTCIYVYVCRGAENVRTRERGSGEILANWGKFLSTI